MLALIDGDVMVYNSGFASDAAAKRAGTTHEPMEFALQGIKQQLDAIMGAARADRHQIYLSHPVNYREQFFPEYKANRDVTHKPHWYDEIKDYLMTEQGAIYSEKGDEADDALGIAQHNRLAYGDTIICTVDKDLDMIPGLHYNWSKTRKDNGIYSIEDPEGLRMFYTQILTGDSSDNIPGMFKKMKIKAADRYKVPLEGMSTEKEMYKYVMGVYNGDEEFVHLNGKLLWIKRNEDFWKAP